MTGKKQKKPAPLVFGPLPVETINKTLDLELEPGNVVMTSNAQLHASRRHAKEYSLTLPHVAAVVRSPLYIGDDFRNLNKIELVGRVPALGSGLLVAIEVTRDRHGNYNVVSFYPVSETKIQNRREKGYLRRARN